MFVPILTVRPAGASPPAGETAAAPRDSTVSLSGLSGRGTDAVAKILEILNQHLVENETLPRRTLLPLLDTLAKVLNMSPQPQESLRDFGKRLAVTIDQLPAAARIALERQLIQRDLVVSLQVLVEALKTPIASPTQRLVMPLIDMTLSKRPIVAGQPETLPSLATAKTQMPLQTMPSILSPIQAAAVATESGQLQKVLKKVFGDDDDSAPRGFEPGNTRQEDEAGTSSARLSRGGGAKAADGRQGLAAAAGAGAGTLGKPLEPSTDSIPLLRAAAAFLATDPEALAMAAAIATGEIDGDLKAGVERELGLSLTETDGTDAAVIAQDAAERDPSKAGAPDRPATDTIFAGHDEGEKQLPPAVASDTYDQSETSAPRTAFEAENQGGPARNARTGERLDATSYTFSKSSSAGASADPGRTAQAARGEGGDFFVPLNERPAKLLAETLKVFVEAGLSLPSPRAQDSTGFIAALPGENSGLKDAETTFLWRDVQPEPTAQLHQTEGRDRATSIGANWLSGTGEQPTDRTAAGLRAGSEYTVAEMAVNLPASQVHQAGVAREAIAFAMVAYFPAAEMDADEADAPRDKRHHAEDEEDAPTDDERKDRDGRERTRDEKHSVFAAPPLAETDDQTDVPAQADAYDLYRRMGGLG